MNHINPASAIVKRPRSTRMRKANVRTRSPDTAKPQGAEVPTCPPLHPILVSPRLPAAETSTAGACPPAAPRPRVLPAPRATLAAVPDPSSLGDEAPASASALPPDIMSITPGGADWWKIGSPTPGPLFGIHLASQQLWSTRQPSVTTQINFTNNLRLATHHAEARKVYDFLLATRYVIARHEVETLEKIFSASQSPTDEHLDAAWECAEMWQHFSCHAAMHTLVGSGSVSDKIATFNALGELNVDLAQVRMLDLSMLHIACIVPMPESERVTLIQYLQWVGCASSLPNGAGLTPLHCLAAQPDPIGAMQALSSTYAAFNARTSEGQTPLFMAYATQPENAAVIAWLLGRGANPRARTNDDETMFHAVLRHGDHPEVVKSLVRRIFSVFSTGGARTMLEQLCRDLDRPNTLRVLDQAFAFPHPLRTVQRPYLGSSSTTAVPPPVPLTVPV